MVFGLRTAALMHVILEFLIYRPKIGELGDTKAKINIEIHTYRRQEYKRAATSSGLVKMDI